MSKSAAPRPRGVVSLSCLMVLLLSGPGATGCESFIYDPPPEVTLNRPAEGSFLSTEPVTLSFSEPIKAESFAFRLWDPVLDHEGELPRGAKPVMERCRLGGEACGQEVTVSAVLKGEDVVGVSLKLPERGIAKPGSTLVLELLDGLSDEQGNTAANFPFYNLQFRAPSERFNEREVPFQAGSYIISSIITDPVPAVLTLITDVVVMPDGRFFAAGGEGDEINGAPKETTDPENLIVDPTEQGWAAHIPGFVTYTEEDERLLDTDPIDLFQPTDPLFVNLRGVRLNGKIIKDEQGDDFIQGSLSFEQLELRIGSPDSRAAVYPGGSQDLVGIFVPQEKAPANHPKVCGDQCGAIVGECSPPPGFPDEDVCEAM